jgi:hypothetical protein
MVIAQHLQLASNSMLGAAWAASTTLGGCYTRRPAAGSGGLPYATARTKSTFTAPPPPLEPSPSFGFAYGEQWPVRSPRNLDGGFSGGHHGGSEPLRQVGRPLA